MGVTRRPLLDAVYRDERTGALLGRDDDGFWTVWVPEGEQVYRREALPLPASADDGDALRVFGNSYEKVVLGNG